MMDKRQRANGLAILDAVADWSREHDWDRRTARRGARLAIMCAMTESNLWQYANRHIPESLTLPHDQVGQDHASVGLFQQQVPGWGTVAELMTTRLATRKFLRALERKGQLPPFAGPELRDRIQAVQVSAYPDGSNYERNRGRSWRFIVAHWDLARRKRR